MNTSRRLLPLVALLGALTFASPREVRANDSYSTFYSDLEPYGSWFEHPDYGFCWQPSSTYIQADWRPYSDGYWVFSDCGWTWVSYEDWGWATYHYGRWANVSRRGWIWIPGAEWGPAWVSWRTGGDYIGWAPLPPRAVWSVSVGFSNWVDNEYDIGPGYYNFCNRRYLGNPSLRRDILPIQQNITIINQTTNITNITYNKVVNKNVIYNQGPDVDYVTKHSDRPIKRLRLETNPSAPSKGHFNHQQGDRLIVAAPSMDAVRSKAERPNRVAGNLGKTQEDNGWGVVSDDTQREQIRARNRQETNGRTAATHRAEIVQPKPFVSDATPDRKPSSQEQTVVGQPGSTDGRPNRRNGRPTPEGSKIVNKGPDNMPSTSTEETQKGTSREEVNAPARNSQTSQREERSRKPEGAENQPPQNVQQNVPQEDAARRRQAEQLQQNTQQEEAMRRKQAERNQLQQNAQQEEAQRRTAQREEARQNNIAEQNRRAQSQQDETRQQRAQEQQQQQQQERRQQQSEQQQQERRQQQMEQQQERRQQQAEQQQQERRQQQSEQSQQQQPQRRQQQSNNPQSSGGGHSSGGNGRKQATPEATPTDEQQGGGNGRRNRN